MVLGVLLEHENFIDQRIIVIDEILFTFNNNAYNRQEIAENFTKIIAKNFSIIFPKFEKSLYFKLTKNCNFSEIKNSNYLVFLFEKYSYLEVITSIRENCKFEKLGILIWEDSLIWKVRTFIRGKCNFGRNVGMWPIVR